MVFKIESSSLSVSECDSGYSGFDLGAKPMSRPTSVYSFNEPHGAKGKTNEFPCMILMFSFLEFLSVVNCSFFGNQSLNLH